MSKNKDDLRDIQNKPIEERLELFFPILEKLQKDFQLRLYAANQVVDNGEVITIIKANDLNPPKEEEKETDNSNKIIK